MSARNGRDARSPSPTYGPWGEAEAVKNPDKLGPTFLTDMAVEIDGKPAEYGDVVAVFRDDTGALCGLGKVMDDSGTLTVVCYAPKGVTLNFKVWLAESGVEEAVVVKCDNASKLVAPESGDFYEGHAISGRTVNEYTVKFNANGGSGTMADQAFLYDAEQALRTNAFTRVGYTFAGWNVSAPRSEDAAGTVEDGAAVSNLTAEAGGVVMLYAGWKNIGPAIFCDIRDEYRTKTDVGVIPVEVVNADEPVKVVVKGLPGGLKFKDGVVSGVPTKSGVYAATVTVTPADRKSKMAPIVKTLTFVVRDSGEHILLDGADPGRIQGDVRGLPLFPAQGRKVRGLGLEGGYFDFGGISNSTSRT